MRGRPCREQTVDYDWSTRPHVFGVNLFERMLYRQAGVVVGKMSAPALGFRR